MKKSKKFLALLLALVMVFSMIPTIAFADGEAETETIYVGTAPKGSTDMYYATLKEAVASVTDSTPTTIVMKKTEYSVFTETSLCTVANGEDITLDLNGNMAWYINTSGSSSQVFKVNKGGKLTIMDSKDIHENGTGGGQLVSGYTPTWTWSGIEGDYSGSYASNVVTNEGTVVVKSGLLCNTSGNGSAVYAIDNYYSGKITVDGGKVQANRSSAIRQFNGTVANGEPQNVVTVNGGIIDGNWMGLQIQSGYVGKIIVNGGTIIGGDYPLSTSGAKKDNVGSKLEIHGGTFDSSTGYGYCSVFSDVEIDGGIFNSAYYSSKTEYITGGTFNNGALAHAGSDYVGMFDDNGNFCSFEKQYDDAGNIIGRTPTTAKFSSPQDKKAYWEEQGYTFVADPTAPGVYHICYEMPLDSSFLAPNYTTIPSKAYPELADDGYVDVVKAYAKVTVDLDYDYSPESYDVYDKTYTETCSLYTTIEDALNNEKSVEASIIATYGGDGYTYNGKNYNYTATNPRNFCVRLARNSNESVTLPVGVTFMVPSGLAYSGKVSAPEGYIVKTTYDDDGTYYSLRVENQKTNVAEKTVTLDAGTEAAAEKTDVPDIKVNETDITTTENYDIAKEVVADIQSNTNVTTFSDVNINPALKSDSSAKDEEQKLDVVLKGIKVETEASTSYSETAIKSVYSETFDVKPMVQVEEATETTVTDEQGNIWKVIPNEEIEGEITFRLPVKKEITKTVAAVYHQANASAVKTLLGFFPIEGNATNGKYIQLSAGEFSIYTYEVMTGVSTTDKLVIKHSDGSFTGYTQLITTGEEPSEVKGAVSEWVVSDTELILMDDYTIGENENFGGKTITLELNGHKLKSNVADNEIMATKVTVQNSGADKDTLAAPGVYANDVTAFAADGYDTKKTTIDGDTLFKKDLGQYTVVVKTTTTTDRDTTNDSPTKNVDVFAGDKVKVTVTVEGATFAAANVTLTFDNANFTGPSAPIGWTKVGDNAYRFYNYKNGGGFYKNGYVLGTFNFTVKAGDSEKLKEMFTVSTSDTYIAPQWSSGWESDPAAKLKAAQLKDDWANIRLKQMTATVTPNTGLGYKEVGQKLLADGYTAKDNVSDAAITTAKIEYAVLTKDEVNGTVFVDQNSDGFDDVYTDKNESTVNPGYVAGMEPKTPTTYTEVQPLMTDADDYVIFWKVSKEGYITVTGQENVSIAPLPVKLTWVMPGDKTTGEGYVAKLLTAPAQNGTSTLNDGTTSVKTNPTEQELTAGTAVKADFFGSHSDDGFYFSTVDMNLTGTGAISGNNMFAYVNALSKNRTAKITMTGKPDVAGENELKVVGTYTFKADLGPNYAIENDEITVLIDGAKIEGFDFAASPDVFFDSLSHVSGTLTNDAENGVTVEFRYSKDGGETWENWVEGKDEIPTLTDANAVPYKVEMRLSKEGSYTRVESINFSIKPVQYFTEKTDYVVGWDLVLCYTDEEVPSFNYDGKQMFDVTAFGYKLGTVWNADGTEITTEGTGYKHVYGIVVEGNAETTKVLPSNTALYTGDNKGTNVDHLITLSGKGRMDVNKSVNEETAPQGSIDINDLVAVAAVYNVDKSYLASADENVIAIVLRADVSGNKMVDTYDCSLIKTNTGK